MTAGVMEGEIARMGLAKAYPAWGLDAFLIISFVSMDLLVGNNVLFFLLATLTTLILPALGKSLVPLFLLGLTSIDGMAAAPLVPVPKFLVLLVAFCLSMAAYSAMKRSRSRVDLTLIGVSAAIGLYYLVDPPMDNPGIAAAYGLLILPLTLALMSFALSVDTVDQRARTAGFALGLFVSVAAGVVEAYLAVGTDYQSYEEVRVFQSSIGSSNFAAAMATTMGFFLIGLASRMPRHYWIIRMVAVPFLASPIILGSRGSLVGAVIVATFLVLSSRTTLATRLLTVLGGIATLAVLMAGILPLDLLILDRFQETDNSSSFLSGRETIWIYVVGLIAEAPLLGNGPGGITNDLLAAGMTAYPHQFILGLLAQVGIIGTVVIVAAIASSFPRRVTPFLPPILFAAAVSMVEPFLSTPGGAAMVACLLSLSKYNERQDR